MIQNTHPYLQIHIEPGRALIAEAGVLVTRVIRLKPRESSAKQFAIVDAGMNDLLRPALYQAWHPVIPLHTRHSEQTALQSYYDIVGPVCESADFLATDRLLDLHSNDLLAIGCAGAYGFSMSSHYNSRPRPAEVLVSGDQWHVIRSREALHDLWHGESIPSN
jgi:diaminopimelate decarboxylase